MIIPENHIALTSTTDVINICQPLFSSTDICYFSYTRFYDDGSVFVLNTHPEWSKHLYKEKLYLANTNIIHNEIYLHNLDETPFSAGIDFRKIFGLDYMFRLFSRKENCWESSSFATKAGNSSIIEFYYNNIDVLKKFKIYFYDKAHELIKLNKKPKNRLILPEFAVNKNLLKVNIDKLKQNTEYRKEILQHIQTNGYEVSTDYGLVRLSHRVLQCLHYLLRGRTAAETAKALNISPKTVEYYLDSVRVKLHCLNRAELFDKFWQLKLAELLVTF